MEEVAAPVSCPQCRTSVVRRVFGFWCPRCQGWLVRRNIPAGAHQDVPMIRGWGIRPER